MFERVRPFVKKEFRQIVRDRRTLAFLLIMFGYALNFDVRHLRLAVYDQAKSRQSREFVERFLHSGYFDLKVSLGAMSEVDPLLDEGVIQIVLVIPPDFSRFLLQSWPTPIQVLVDGQESNVARTAIGYVNAIAQDYSNDIAARAVMRRGGRTLALPVDFEPRVWYNPDLKSSRFLVPGLMAFILMIVVVISTALSVVREREMGSIEQIVVSPVKPLELIVGKTIPYAVISLFAAHLVLLFGYLFFGVSIKGNYGWLLLGIILFLIGGLGLGLLISTIARSQQVAFMAAVLSTMLPTFVLSGFIFPIRNMPVAIQAVTYFIPARYFLFMLRSIMLKGVGPGAFWVQIVFLAAFAALTLGVSALRLGRSLKRGL
jgi:ABC-2 type transport system permease protein